MWGGGGEKRITHIHIRTYPLALICFASCTMCVAELRDDFSPFRLVTGLHDKSIILQQQFRNHKLRGGEKKNAQSKLFLCKPSSLSGNVEPSRLPSPPNTHPPHTHPRTHPHPHACLLNKKAHLAEFDTGLLEAFSECCVHTMTLQHILGLLDVVHLRHESVQTMESKTNTPDEKASVCSVCVCGGGGRRKARTNQGEEEGEGERTRKRKVIARERACVSCAWCSQTL